MFGIRRGRGYSQQQPRIPKTMLRTCKAGTGLTAASRDLEKGELLDDYYSKEQFTAVGNLLCPHIPENLGPKDPMEAGCNLVSCCREDDETSQMVLDESSHFGGIFF